MLHRSSDTPPRRRQQPQGRGRRALLPLPTV